MRVIFGFLATLAVTASASAGAQTVYSGAPPGYRDYDRGQTIVCESQDGHYNRCQVPWDGGVRMVQQISESACIRGQTWGERRHSVWVNQGCRARFAPAGYVSGGPGGWAPPPGWNHRFEVSCGSPQYHYAFCQVDVGRQGRVFMRRQTSDAACVEGSTWGWNRAGIWVDRGCSANFVVDRRW
ncbi:MAG TPA: DUF3011 domain-containing protein [Rhodanobacteraceae bacterium]|nr:DUF3011 domain-containing protein [Rhodanobacteraceae bacterium]